MRHCLKHQPLNGAIAINTLSIQKGEMVFQVARISFGAHSSWLAEAAETA